MPIERAYCWAETLLKHINSKRLFVLDTIRPGEYIADLKQKDPNELFFRQLQTAVYRSQEKVTGIPYLEPPNLMSGAFAAVLSNCQKGNKSALGLVTLAEKTTSETSNYEQNNLNGGYGVGIIEIEALQAFEKAFHFLIPEWISTPKSYDSLLGVLNKNQVNELFL